jgi:transposase
MWKAKNKIKQNVASLPRGAVGKGAFAVGFWQLRAATLGKIFPARVFPALLSVVAWGARQKKIKKIKNRLCRRLVPHAPGTGIFSKKKEKPSLPTASMRGSQRRIF